MKDTLKLRVQTNVIAAVAGLAVAGALAVIAAYLIGFSVRTDDIQQSRADNVRSACIEQNERHDKTIDTLDALLDEAKRGATPARVAQLDQSRASTVLLIDALAPKRNCEQRVRALVGTPAD